MKGDRSLWTHLPTEQIHPSSWNLDTKTPSAVLRLMAAEDRRVIGAVYKESKRIEKGAGLMASAIEQGGRIIYVGAGTSGRLGVLEAAECPPTFGTAPWQIQAVMAGGRSAVFRAKEGAEDRKSEARRELRVRGIGKGDLVLGISASSVTPFVRSGLAYARARKAKTLLVTCGPRVRGLADLVIAPAVGPEIIAGSTRLKSATATKLVLNALTVLAMTRLGKLYGPFMVDLKPGSAKLRDRSRRMVAAIAGTSLTRASRLLADSRGDVKAAIVSAKLDLTVGTARRKLAAKKGHLRAVLDM